MTVLNNYLRFQCPVMHFSQWRQAQTEGDREGQPNTSQGSLIPIWFDLEPQLAALRKHSHLEKTEKRRPRQRKLDAISPGVEGAGEITQDFQAQY